MQLLPTIEQGFLGNLSADQQQVLDQVRKWLAREELDSAGRFDDVDLLRFCRARNFDSTQVQGMIRNYFEWRVREGIDTIHQFEYPELKAVLQHYTFGYHGVTRKGYPLVFDCCGTVNGTELWRATTKERMLRYQLKFLEEQHNFRFKACSASAGTRIQMMMSIYDFSEAGMSTTDYTMVDCYRQLGKICSDTYPETLYKIFCIKVPMAMRFVIGMVKGFVDEKTRRKFVVCGYDYMN